MLEAIRSVEEALYPIVCDINTYLSNYVLVFLLVGVGLWYSIQTKFVQVRCFGEGMKKVFGNLSLRGGKQKSGMTSFQALATAIAAQVGTGNIVGASGAILAGGPGAIFWMWVIAFLGMATIYAEATLAIKTRKTDADGPLAAGYAGAVTETISKTNLAQTAFGSVLGGSIGSGFVAICLFFFAFSTVLSWNMFGKVNVQYLFGKKGVKVYSVLALVFIFLGTMVSNDLVWELTDAFNYLMVLPNALALFALTKVVKDQTPGLKK